MATINGTSGNNIITIGAGDDIINSGAGNDVINAGSGNDVIEATGKRFSPLFTVKILRIIPSPDQAPTGPLTTLDLDSPMVLIH